MLAVARLREGGSAVTWIEADARSVRLGGRFALVLLTGLGAAFRWGASGAEIFTFVRRNGFAHRQLDKQVCLGQE